MGQISYPLLLNSIIFVLIEKKTTVMTHFLLTTKQYPVTVEDSFNLKDPEEEARLLDKVPSTIWRLLLLGDGSMTRNLTLLTGGPIQVKVLEHGEPESEVTDPCEPWLKDVQQKFTAINEDITTRSVLLQGGPEGESLVFAVSWWKSADLKTFFLDENAVRVPPFDKLAYALVLATCEHTHRV
eukprot:gb/GECG01003303.1/.p1 GENE.gb/GECG01003303.1/~~gb/GECG01003303.1/.p1  ORF type:complete len:183 (+),score=12.34 gb/GECG01003303.1/:1-549(+)